MISRDVVLASMWCRCEGIFGPFKSRLHPGPASGQFCRDSTASPFLSEGCDGVGVAHWPNQLDLLLVGRCSGSKIAKINPLWTTQRFSLQRWPILVRLNLSRVVGVQCDFPSNTCYNTTNPQLHPRYLFKYLFLERPFRLSRTFRLLLSQSTDVDNPDAQTATSHIFIGSTPHVAGKRGFLIAGSIHVLEKPQLMWHN